MLILQGLYKLYCIIPIQKVVLIFAKLYIIIYNGYKILLLAYSLRLFMINNSNSFIICVFIALMILMALITII